MSNELGREKRISVASAREKFRNLSRPSPSGPLGWPLKTRARFHITAIMSTSSAKIFAERLEEAIRTKRFKKGEVAEAVGVANSTVTKWIQGGNLPEVETLLALCRYLGVTPNWLLGVPEADATKGNQADPVPHLVAVMAPAEEVARVLARIAKEEG